MAIALIPGEDGKVLMGKRRDSGKLTTPGGHLEIGEDPYSGVIREVKEETGLQVTKAELVSTGITEFGTIIFTFLCKAEGSVDTSNDPDQECPGWFFADPLENLSSLHIPFERSFPFQWLKKNQKV